MGLKILIVEDQFIEANDLRIILERAGHSICGIAKSVNQAIDIIRSARPEIVLLDIFLDGSRTGIDLANTLTSDNIPFIYLSANSDESTFEAAKATHPYGFLVKPFREKDILNALDIANYRHNHAIELMRRQEKWFAGLLDDIVTETGSTEQKLLLLAKAFQPFMHFDFFVIDTNIRKAGPGSVYAFQRAGYDDYIGSKGWEFLNKINIALPELNVFRECFMKKTIIHTRNETSLTNKFPANILEERLNQIHSIRSGLYVPVSSGKEIEMSISFYSVQLNYFTTEHEELIASVMTLVYNVIRSICQQKDKSPSIPEWSGVTGLTVPLSPFHGIIGKSPTLMHILDQVKQVAAFDTTVLIQGETGVGKEGIANAIHQLSGRNSKPYIKINCAAIPSALIESELFGHEKGAFTNAFEKRIGKFEQAQGGTIFLDEIGEMPLEVQSKLLRVLQEKEIERIGGRSTIKIDVRIIAATNRNLYKEAGAGKFRIDLYYRINVFPISLPPLKERREDIPLLVNHFLQQNAKLSGNKPKQISQQALRVLINYSWPGNIRELQHLIERHILISSSMTITSIELPKEEVFESKNSTDETFQSIADVDKAHILAVLKKCNGKISGKGGAAEILKIPSTTLTSKMKKLGIEKRHFE